VKKYLIVEFFCFLGLVCVGFLLLPFMALWWGKSKAFSNPSIVRNRYACGVGPLNHPREACKNDRR
jgi:hypothetical protein